MLLSWLRPICRDLLSQCTRACANALGIWLPVSHAPSCIVTTNSSRTGLNPLTRTQRSKLIQLKFGILPLKYETDRYQGIAPQRWLCKLCTLNEPEDEIHFLFQCPTLSTTRVTFFQRFSDNHLEFGDDHFENMSNLLKREYIVSMGLFTKSLYKERQIIMYMWWSLKYVNKQHCPHCALPLSFISVLFWYIFIIIYSFQYLMLSNWIIWIFIIIACRCLRLPQPKPPQSITTVSNE